MLRIFTAILLVSLFSAVSFGRISSFGAPAEYGLASDTECWYDINQHTWDVFVSMDSDKILGINDKRLTVFQVEYYSTAVLEGLKVGDNTVCASFSDRGGFFGGEGYMDLFYYAPIDVPRYAQQAVFYGGWKYNLNRYVDIDLGGIFTYSTKRVAGPGIAGYGGETFRDDFYVGFCFDKIYVNPFVYFDYCSEYDAKKYMAGIRPSFDLEPYTAISGLSLDLQLTLGYVRACRFAGEYEIGGMYWRNDYSYIQGEANLVYCIDKIRMFVGIGWACNNAGKRETVGSVAIDMGPDQMVWGACGIGYVF